MFEKLSHIMMWTADFDRALAWYQEKLGCKVNFSHAPHYASLQLEEAGLRIDLHPTNTDGKDVGFGPIPYLAVKDIDAVTKTLAEKGIKVGDINEEGGHRFATFWDSEGNALGLQQI